MANKININNLNEWLHSLGYFFPRNTIEEKRFDKLYSDYNHELDEKLVDPLNIISSINESSIANYEFKESKEISESKHEQEWKLAARNKGNISKKILDKMKKNQSNSKDESK